VIQTESIDRGFILLLQATAPLRTLADLNGLCATFAISDSAEAIVSLVEHDTPHPDKIQKIEGGRVVPYLGRGSMVPRQSLPEVYSLNGAFYLTHRDVLIGRRTLIPKEPIPFVMPVERSVNLDDPLDLVILQALIERGYYKIEEYD
jgi:CMP-N,N'-diacetyllegionaminic acid synthase